MGGGLKGLRCRTLVWLTGFPCIFFYHVHRLPLRQGDPRKKHTHSHIITVFAEAPRYYSLEVLPNCQ